MAVSKLTLYRLQGAEKLLTNFTGLIRINTRHVASKSGEIANLDAEAKKLTLSEVLKPEAVEKADLMKDCFIEVEQPTNLMETRDNPVEQIKTRLVRIYQPTKNAMQSGTDNTRNWKIDFDTQSRWENPLMGWCSTGDPLSNMQLAFSSKEEAIDYCNITGWNWYVQASYKQRKFKPKSYSDIFAWNKRTRVSTK